MRKSKAETAETRKRIIEIAARMFKRNGIHATGVSEIMAAAGMTHGGFYRHFSSKEQLVAAACAANLEELVDAAQVAVDGGDETFLQHLADILSAEYRDDCSSGCPLIAMGSELVRADPEARRAASHGFEGMIDALAQRGGATSDVQARETAIFTLSSLVGAMTLARIVDDPDLSIQILDVTRQRLGVHSKLQPTHSREVEIAK